MNKLHLCVVLLLLILPMLSCTSEFAVDMQECRGAAEPITLRIVLPDTNRESEITFILSDTAYSITSMPTVSDPTFVLYSQAADALPYLALRLDSEAEYAELHMRTKEDESLLYTAELDAFARLTDYCGRN